jgi:hypothetical protein
VEEHHPLHERAGHPQLIAAWHIRKEEKSSGEYKKECNWFRKKIKLKGF